MKLKYSPALHDIICKVIGCVALVAVILAFAIKGAEYGKGVMAVTAPFMILFGIFAVVFQPRAPTS